MSNAQTKNVSELQRFSYTEYHMGVDARIVVYAPDKNVAEKACTAAFAKMAELDSAMSDYRKDSELMKLCEKSGSGAVKVSPDLFRVLQKSVEMSRKTAGAFDISVGPLVTLWRAARKSGALPDPLVLESARKLVGWKNIVLNSKTQTCRLKIPGMKLDLGGIAKGYACDQAISVLNKNGVSRALVEMGGDIVVSDSPPKSKGWMIRIPNAGEKDGPVDLPFSNCAVSSSGDTEQFVVIGGKRYSHVVDPRTGQALTNRVQATVITRRGFDSDPLSKVPSLMTKSKWRKLLKTYPHTRAYVRRLTD